MSEATHLPLPHAEHGDAADVIPLRPEVPPSEILASMSDTDCVALLIEYGLHASVRPDAMYPTLYHLMYEGDSNDPWHARIDDLIHTNTDDIYQQHAADPILAELITSLRGSKNKLNDEGIRAGRKVLVGLVELRCIELRDETDSNWSAFLSKLPSLQ